MKCPVKRHGKPCPGTLLYTHTEQTSVSYKNGLDRNTNVEEFQCSVCEIKLKRSWKWEEVGKKREDETLRDGTPYATQRCPHVDDKGNRCRGILVFSGMVNRYKENRLINQYRCDGCHRPFLEDGLR